MNHACCGPVLKEPQTQPGADPSCASVLCEDDSGSLQENEVSRFLARSQEIGWGIRSAEVHRTHAWDLLEPTGLCEMPSGELLLGFIERRMWKKQNYFSSLPLVLRPRDFRYTITKLLPVSLCPPSLPIPPFLLLFHLISLALLVPFAQLEGQQAASSTPV